MKEINEYVNENYEIALKLLRDLVSIRSVRGISQVDAPFGINIFMCQQIIETFCMENNIPYKNLNNYISFSHYGNPLDYISLWSHIDIVPEGNISKWTTNPFILTRRNGNLYG